MADGTKLAIAILVIWLSLVFFFFAFHPGGVKNVTNPGTMLKWLMEEFANLAGGNTSETAAELTSAGTNSDALSYPGYTSGSSDIGNATGKGVQLA